MTLLDLPQVPLTLTHARTDRSDVLSVTGYLDSFTVPLLEEKFLEAVERLDHSKSESLTVDLSCVRFIDRAGLELLLRARRRIADQDRSLVIRLRPGSQPETLFAASKVDGLITVQIK